MKRPLFTAEDVRQMESLGITPSQVKAQLALFRKTCGFLRLHRPCTVGDGIQRIPETQFEALIALQEQAAQRGRFSKFLPASGAATRMFQSLFTHRESEKEGGNKGDSLLPADDPSETFCRALPRFPFYEVLKAVMDRDGVDLEQRLAQKNGGKSSITSSRTKD